MVPSLCASGRCRHWHSGSSLGSLVRAALSGTLTPRARTAAFAGTLELPIAHQHTTQVQPVLSDLSLTAHLVGLGQPHCYLVPGNYVSPTPDSVSPYVLGCLTVASCPSSRASLSVTLRSLSINFTLCSLSPLPSSSVFPLLFNGPRVRSAGPVTNLAFVHRLPPLVTSANPSGRTPVTGALFLPSR